MILSSVTHDIKSNSLEAVWLVEVLDVDGSVVRLDRVKCQSYSVEQRADFTSDTGAPQYADLAGWPAD
jgi:hypothetical protein